MVFIKAKKGRMKTWYEHAAIVMEELYEKSMATEVPTRGASYNNQYITGNPKCKSNGGGSMQKGCA